MTQKLFPVSKVALLATGSEIQDGDILNTNAQQIAIRLFDHGVPLGMHMVTGDSISEIHKAIGFLLESHGALIITGGLGPTSDDVTRYALSEALQKELVLDSFTWDAIVSRMTHFGFKNIPQANRQQALFPIGASILPNPHGTAAGCFVEHQHQCIFMLPGPPVECLPMFEKNVLPLLIERHFQKKHYQKKWLLFGVSEGHIAEELDAIAKPYQCTTGYRLWYPYIEFKIFSENKEDFDALLPLIEKAVASIVLQDGKETASELLKKQLISLPFSVTLCDRATGGLLESVLKTPKTLPHVSFSSTWQGAISGLSVYIQGLDDYWQDQKTTNTTLNIQMVYQNKKESIHQTIPFRGERVKQYAVEMICQSIYRFLTFEF